MDELNLTWMIVAVSALLLVSLVTLKTTAKGSYKSNVELLTKSEMNFYRQLKRAMNNNCQIHYKVRLADLVSPNSSDKTLLYKVLAKHIDFTLVEESTSRILLAIELDDASHNSFSAAKRDSEKNKAMASAGVELIRVKARRIYSKATFERINSLVNSLSNENNNDYVKPVVFDKCPRCGKPEIEKVMMKFPNKGKYFHLCNNCRFRTEPLSIQGKQK